MEGQRAGRACQRGGRVSPTTQRLSIALAWWCVAFVSHRSATASVPAAPNTPVVFLHIPKNGGTSLNRYFFSNWGLSCDQFQLQGHTLKELTADLSSQAPRPRSRRAACRWVHVHVGGPSPTRDTFKELASCHGLRPRYLSGHMDFGACSYMQRGCEYVTVFRDPLSRMLSHYKYLKTRHPHLLEEYCAELEGGCPSIAAYVEGVHQGKVWFYGVANHQTLFMAGNEHFNHNHTCGKAEGFVETDLSPELGFSKGDNYDPRLLQVAKDHLRQRTPVFGFLDDLHTFQAQMEARYGYSWVVMPTLNQAPGMALADLDGDTLAKMSEIQRMDIELLEYAKELLAARTKGLNVTFGAAANVGVKRKRRYMLPSSARFPRLARYTRKHPTSQDPRPRRSRPGLGARLQP